MALDPGYRKDLDNLKQYLIDLRQGRMDTRLDVDSSGPFYELGLELMQLRDTLAGATSVHNKSSLPLADLLSRKMQEMEILLAAQQAMSSSLDMDRVLELIIAECKEVMQAEAASMIVLDPDTLELTIMLAESPDGVKVKHVTIPPHAGIAGWVADHGEPLLVPDVSRDTRFYKSVDLTSGFTTKSILCVPMRYKGEITGVLEVLNKINDQQFQESDISLFQGLANLAAIAYENARMSRELVIREAMNRELEIAHEIQMGLLPQQMPEYAGYDIFALTRPAKQVGGDYFDFIDLGPDRLGMAIADVSGKGVPAGLYMTMARSLLHAIAREAGEPIEVVKKLNLELFGAMKASSFITILYLELDTARGRIKLVNAGHLPALVIRDDERAEYHASAPPIGILGAEDFDEHIRQEEFELGAGHLLALYTDGVTEAEYGDGLYGDERLIRFAADNAGLDAEALVQAIVNQVKQPPDSQGQTDDITIIAVKRTS